MSDYRDDEDELSDTDDSEPEQQASRAPFDPELDSDDDEGDREDVVSAPAAQTSFSLRGGSLAFSDRSHSIFGGLDSVTQLTSSPLNQGPVTDTEFIQPQPPHPGRKVSQPLPTSPTPPKKRGVPDYLVHPERWTHYSLEDVTETSDQDNRRAAYNFLSSLQQERWRDSSCDIQQRMIFSRPQRLLKEQSSDQLSSDRGKKRRMHLSHLDEGEGEEEEKEEKARGTEQSEEETEEQDTRGAVGQPEEEKQRCVQVLDPRSSSAENPQGS
ncbi:U5 small nuclear ribonucleoprotein TSSC4 isoform X2 [Trachinotus anak]|uniref:U5 small nuclear ribonucleoprotein TSSC4 isoform X2 n=1 Tax=Trachinotus anak TaxID=443729 RepID=UPI0039F20E4E